MKSTENLIRAGFVAFGEVNSPQQLIKDKCLHARKEIESLGIKLITTEHVNDDPAGIDILRAVKDLRTGEFDFLVVCIAGWIPSHAVIAVTEEFKHLPMILWGLCGDIENGRLITAAPQAGTTALRKVFSDLGYKFRYIYNIVGEPSPLNEILKFAIASRSVKTLRRKKIGMMGFRDMKLFNTLYEGLSLKTRFGIEIEFFEMLELEQRYKTITDNDIRTVINKIKEEWHFDKPVPMDFLVRGVTYFLVLKKIIEENRFNAISLKDVDGMKRLLNFPPAMIFMLLSDEMGLCTIPENDAMGAVTQLIIKELTGQCAAYLEYYEFFKESLLLGAPDFVPEEIIQGKVKVTPAAFGDIPGGMLNISNLKTGKLTLSRLSNTGSDYIMHTCTGEGRLKDWEEAGWDKPAPQLPSLEIFLDKPVNEFAQKISGQHYIIAYGDHTETINNFCYLTDIKMI